MEEKDTIEKIKRIKEMKKKKRIKIIIIVAISLMVGGLVIGTTMYQLDKEKNIFGGKISSIFKNDKANQEEISPEEEAKQQKKAAKVAVKKFKQLGEETQEADLEILKIKRDGKLYYYISSKENTVEVRIEDNKITRVNSVLVE